MKENSIGTVTFGKERKYYIIKKGKSFYIPLERFFELMDMNYEINQPLYTE